MRSPRLSAVFVCALLHLITSLAVWADWIPTNVGTGADAEVRDHQSTTNFGLSTELGMRVVNSFPAGHASDGTDRYSLIYTRFDLTGQTLPPSLSAAFRLTVRNTNLTANRLHDHTTPNLAHRAGLAVYGLSPSAPAWSETTITYANAPGLLSDGNNGSKDLVLSGSALTFLGTVMLPPLGVQNHLPVGGAIVFRSPALNNFIVTAVNGGATQVTLVTVLIHGGDQPMNDMRNFTYLFNPKEQGTLLTDASYDADITNPSNPLGSPHSGASNATGTYSPALSLDSVPVPPLSLINVEPDRVDLQLGPTADGFPFQIERSRALNGWTRIGTVIGSTVPVTFSDTRQPDETQNFYRATQ